MDKNVTNITARTTQDTGDFFDEETDGEEVDDDADEEEEVCSVDADDDIENGDDSTDEDVVGNTDNENDLVSWLIRTTAVVAFRGILTHQLTRVSVIDRPCENV